MLQHNAITERTTPTTTMKPNDMQSPNRNGCFTWISLEMLNWNQWCRCALHWCLFMQWLKVVLIEFACMVNKALLVLFNETLHPPIVKCASCSHQTKITLNMNAQVLSMIMVSPSCDCIYIHSRSVTKCLCFGGGHGPSKDNHNPVWGNDKAARPRA